LPRSKPLTVSTRCTVRMECANHSHWVWCVAVYARVYYYSKRMYCWSTCILLLVARRCLFIAQALLLVGDALHCIRKYCMRVYSYTSTACSTVRLILLLVSLIDAHTLYGVYAIIVSACAGYPSTSIQCYATWLRSCIGYYLCKRAVL